RVKGSLRRFAPLTRLRLGAAGGRPAALAVGAGQTQGATPMSNKPGTSVTIELPLEFIVQCRQDGVTPEVVLRGFIADLCGLISWANNPRTDGYCSNGSDERRMAREY